MSVTNTDTAAAKTNNLTANVPRATMQRRTPHDCGPVVTDNTMTSKRSPHTRAPIQVAIVVQNSQVAGSLRTNAVLAHTVSASFWYPGLLLRVEAHCVQREITACAPELVISRLHLLSTPEKLSSWVTRVLSVAFPTTRFCLFRNKT